LIEICTNKQREVLHKNIQVGIGWKEL